MAGGTIDAIKVGLGIDYNDLRSQLASARREFERAIPANRTVNVSIKTHVDQASIASAYRSIQASFVAHQRQGANSPTALKIAPRMVVDPRVMRDFRRDIERNMLQAGRAGQALHVPIKFNGDVKGFLQSVQQSIGSQHVVVTVKGHWGGWDSGGGPPSGGGPHGGGGPVGGSWHGPTGPQAPPPPRAPNGPMRYPSPPPAQSAPSRSSTARTRPATVRTRGGVEVDSSDRYEVQAPLGSPANPRPPLPSRPGYVVSTKKTDSQRPTPGSQRATRGTRTAQQDIDEVAQQQAEDRYNDPTGRYPTPSQPPTPRQRRQQQRRATMSGAVPPAGRSGGLMVNGRGLANGTGRGDPDRVDISSVRYGSVQPELQGSDRVDAIRQSRARSTPAIGWAPQLNEPQRSPEFTANAETFRQKNELRVQLAQRLRARARMLSPRDEAGRAFLANPGALNEGLGGALGILSDPEFAGNYAEHAAGRELASQGYGDAFHGMDKRTKRAKRAAAGYGGRVNYETMDPILLGTVAGLDAQRSEAEIRMNPLAVVKTGDNKLRGKGGKVGRIGGRNAGRLGSESVDPENVEDAYQRLKAGGRGNGAKSLEALGYTKAEISAARGRIMREPKPVEPAQAGVAYGGFLEDAPSIPGGQGITRGNPKPPAPLPALAQQEHNARMAAIRGAEGKVAGRDLGLGQTGSPSAFAEWWNKREMAKTKGRSLFYRRAEGGAKPGVKPSLLRRERFLGMDEPAPRPGSKARLLIENQYGKRMKERSRKEKRNPHLNNSYEWKKIQNAYRTANPDESCYFCGRENMDPKDPVHGQQPTVDHLLDVERGGTDDWNNLVTACRSCNGKKSGGRSARKLPSFAETQFNTRMAQLGGRSNFAEGGRMRSMWKWGKGYAEGGAVLHTGLADRMALAGHQPTVTEVGERGRELIVSDEKGESEVIPTHKVPTWLARAQDPRGMGATMGGLGKEFRRRASGGYMGRFAAEPGSGLRGRKVYRDAFDGERQAVASGGLSPMGNVQRVFVTNWPAIISSAQGFAQGLGQAARSAPAGGAAAAGAAGVGSPPPAGGAAGAAGAGAAGGGLPGTVPGAPTAGSRPTRLRPANPLTRVEAREQGYGRVESLRERLGTTQSDIGEALQRTPVRALSVAFGQIAQNVIGGREGILDRSHRARLSAARANVAIGSLEGLESQRAEARSEARRLRSAAPGTDEATQYDAAVAKVRELTPAIRKQRGVAGRRLDEAEDRTKAIVTTRQQIKSQAVGLGGIIAGTTAFSAAIAATAAAGSAAATALNPLVQQLLGWPTAIDQVTSSIRDSIQAMNGNVRAGTAAAVAPSGISAAYLDAQGQRITSTGAYRAAATAGAQAQDITRAARGPVKGLYEGTGGLLGTNVLTELFGGQPGALQTVAGRISTNAPVNQLNTRSPADGGFLGQFPNDRYTYEQLQKNPNEPFAATGQRSNREFMRDFEASLGAPGGLTATVKDLNSSLESAAAYAGDAGKAFQLVTDATDAQKNAMIESAAKISNEAKTRAEDFARSGVAVVGPGGKALDPNSKQFGDYADQQARGMLIQDPALLLRARAPQRAAQAFQLQSQADFARNEDNPAAFALQRLGNRPIPYGSTFSTRGQQLDEATLKRLADNSASASKYAALNADYSKKGLDAQEKIVARIDTPSYAGGISGGPISTAGGLGGRFGAQGGAGSNLTAFRALRGQVAGLGEQKQALQVGLAERSAALQADAYANTLRITTRSLTDAEDLWSAITGHEVKGIGGLQGQNMLLDRQNQLLSRRSQKLSFKSEDLGFKQSDLQIQAQNLGFAQSQRQINFQKSIAGFSAPGLTPEERAARINEAKVEAEYSQKQLDLQIAIAAYARQQLGIAKQQAAINRQQFGNQNQQQDNAFLISIEQARRAIPDLKAQLHELTEGRAIEIDTASVTAATDIMQTQIDTLTGEMQTYLEQGQGIRGVLAGEIADMMAATGKGFSELETQVTSAWRTAFQGLATATNGYIAQISSGGGGGGGGGQDRIPLAAGGIAHVNQPTRFMAGEAGGEHVIVLRNAQQGMMAMGGGGGGGTTINVGGISITLQGSGKNEDDAAAIAAIVEQRLSRKLAMIGG